KKKLLNVNIPELYFQGAMMLFSEYQREFSKKETPTVKVVPTLTPEDIPDELPEYSELLEQWTVTFGMRRNGSRSILIGNGNASGDGRFPLRIKATLIDPLVDFAVNKKSSESKDVSLESFSSHLNNINLNEIVIQISLSTYYHESYLDLNNWIVYLENDNIGQFEPVRIETRETPFVKEPKMFNFFSYPDDEESPEMPQSRSQQQRFFRDPMKTAFYRIVFKNKTNGDPIITEYTRFLKLVFLKEIGTNEKSEGKWVFEIPNNR
ncbi:hypothetical protein KAS50_01645, partial [bacterium]|nr:hypothetical protein [bacterium]